MSRTDGTHHYGLSPLAGVSAGTAAVLFAFGVLALAWHRVAGQVSTGITVLVYAVIGTVALIMAMAAWLAFLWVRHRARNPHLLAPRQAPRAGVAAAEAVPPAIEAAAEPRAIEPPRVYLNLTDDQFAAIMRHHTEGE